MADIPTVTTERLTLRPWRPGDLDAFAAQCADAETMRYIGAGTPISREEAVAVIEGYLAEWERVRHGRWAVELSSTGEFIGGCGLVRWKEGTPEATGEVAYGFARAHWRLGYATEAARAAVSWGFANFDWETVVGLTHPDNAASQRVLAKLGMVAIGHYQGRHGVLNVYGVGRGAFRG